MSEPQINPHSNRQRLTLRVTIAAVGLLLCFWGMWSALQAGASRLLSDYGLSDGLLDKANAAIRIAPSDAEAHYARAVVLADAGQNEEAIKAFERAVALRPRDYVMWIELGRARDQAGDIEGALAAFREAARRAPHYAQPRWRLGNVLLRAGRRDEAFAELRRAAISDPTLFPILIDLAWDIYQNDVPKVEQAVQPQTSNARLALARFFAKHGKGDDAVRLFNEAGSVPELERRALLTELLTAKQFPKAYEVWVSGRAQSKSNDNSAASVTDGSFESGIPLKEPGFGWQLAGDLQTVRFSLDPREKRTGASSLAIDFNGASDPSTQIVSQLVLVEPHTRYRLSFAARTQEVVTGGLPIVVVLDANSSDGRPLAESKALPQGTNGWQQYTIEFATANETKAVRLALQRQSCSRAPCPIFGRVWLDDFLLQKQ